MHGAPEDEKRLRGRPLLRTPLLAQERWYAQAKRGYARGWEPAQFVDRVQRFLTLLEWAPTEAIAHGTRVEIEPEA